MTKGFSLATYLANRPEYTNAMLNDRDNNNKSLRFETFGWFGFFKMVLITTAILPCALFSLGWALNTVPSLLITTIQAFKNKHI